MRRSVKRWSSQFNWSWFNGREGFEGQGERETHAIERAGCIGIVKGGLIEYADGVSSLSISVDYSESKTT